MIQFHRITVSSSMVLLLLLVSQNNFGFATAQKNDLDYTCDPYKDKAWDNQCLTTQDKVCDDPNHGGDNDDCIGQDCIDCNYLCGTFDADCYGCVNTKGCFYCPSDGLCQNSNKYTSSNKVYGCSEDEYLSMSFGSTPDECVANDAYTKDPLYGGSQWMFEMINLIEVWDEYGLTGKGVTVRINDDGVYVDNNEFTDRFDDADNSCSDYLPLTEDDDGHGTAVAGIIMGNANNDQCAVGIAHQAKFSSCNFFAKGNDYTNMAYKLDTFDISQNSIGMPACEETNGLQSKGDIIYDEGCPFTYEDSRYEPCNVCKDEFVSSDRSLSAECDSAIYYHCKYFYKEDVDACSDFPEIIIGGQCNYDKIPKNALTALEFGITQGREGKGVIFVFASGNSFEEGDDVNFSGWTNSRYTISVGAVGKDGYHADYSTSGAALLVSAPSGADQDTGHLMTAGLGVDTCADSGQGTSFACPVVSGVIALMLETNPELSWRDVQGILAVSSTNVEDDEEDGSQTTNGVGIWHSNWYGFGIVNAKAAVDAAMGWSLYTEELQAIGISKAENKELADDDGNQFTSTIDLDPSDDQYPKYFLSESTVVLLDLSHYNRGDLEIELESPSGTISMLHPGKRPESSQLEGEQRWKLMTAKNWGEDPTGKWKLTVRDLVDREETLDKNVFRGWKIIVYGRSESGETGFGVGDNNSDDGDNESAFCLDPDAPGPGCIYNNDGDFSCPAKTTFTWTDGKVTVDAHIVCPNDVLLDEDIDAYEASKRGLCSCPASLFDENCDNIEKDLECDCFACPSGGVAYSCNKEILQGCKSLDCDGTCNDAFEFPLEKDGSPKIEKGSPTLNPTQEPTKLPTESPTKNPTQNPTKNPTQSPTTNSPTKNLTTKNPTKSPTQNPTQSPTTNSPTKDPTKEPTQTPSSNPTQMKLIPSDSPTAKSLADLITDEDLLNQVEEKDREVEEDSSVSEDFKDEGNLSCQNAMPISSSSPPVEGTISSLPLVGVQGPCLAGLETVGGWYQIIGNGNIFSLTACSLEPSKSVGISVFTKDCSQSECIEHQSRQIVACENGNGHSASFATESGTPYNILISGIPLETVLPGSSIGSSSSQKKRRHLQSPELKPDFRLEVTETEAPTNSKCGSAYPATFDKSVKGNTMGLLTTFKTCGKTEKSGAWYTVEGGESKEEDGVIVYEANTCNRESNFYNTMSVFLGNSCSNHNCVDVDVLPCPSGWFGQQVYWSTNQKDEIYRIFVHSSDAIEAETYNAGTFQLDLDFNDRLENDQCNAALKVELNREQSVKSRTLGAKPDMKSIENSSCGSGGAGAWYKAKGTGGVLQASTCSGETDHKTSIQVYSGECGRLSCLDSADGNKALCSDGNGSVVNFKTQEDVDYFILVTGRREDQTGNFRLQVMEEDPEKNDVCTEAVALTAPNEFVDGSTLQATVDFLHDDTCVVPLDTPGVWYTIEGTGKAIEVNVCKNNEFEAAISIFKGSCPSLLECVTGSSATDAMCSGVGVATSFFGEKGRKYYVYVHGKSRSSNNMGDFTLSYRESKISEANEFCPEAKEVPTDGTRIEGSTEDSTHVSIPVSSCGVEITKPGLWYTFQGNGQPFGIDACSEDEGDFDVSVSIFEGGPGGCDSLNCLAGTTFVDTCQSNQLSVSSAVRFMTEPQTNYYVFVHGTDVGDFTLSVQDENLVGFGTASPTETPRKHARDLYRWIPVKTTLLLIPTDYLELEFVFEPVEGTASITGYQIKYIPPEDFTGDDVMTLNGCNDGDCYLFDVTVHSMGERIDPTAAAGNGFNMLWLLLLLVPLLILAICYPFYRFYKNKNNNSEDSEDNLSSERFDDDYSNGYGGEKNLLNSQRSSGRGMGDSGSGADWDSSDNDDDDDESRDSRDEESISSDDDDGDDDDTTAYGSSNDGFRDEFGQNNNRHNNRRRHDP